MAIDATTLQPIRVYQTEGSGGKGFQGAIPAYLDDAEAASVGDVLVIDASTGRVIIDNDAPVAANVVGIALDALTAAATALETDFVLVAPALTGQIFEANISDDAGDADDNGFDFVNFAYEGFDINDQNTGGIPVIDIGTATTGTAVPLGPSRSQIRGLTADSDTTSGTLNMRVMFIFSDSVFMTPPVS